MPRTVAFDDVHAVFAALAKGVLGPRYQPEIPQVMYDTTRFFPSDAERQRVLAAFKFLGSRGGALALTGRATPVSWLNPQEAERVVTRWKDSRLPLQRQLAGAVISLSANALYGHPTPQWERFGYQGPLGDPPAKGDGLLHPSTIDDDAVLDCDVVIVGSGAGGGCAAAVLAEAGLDVIVLEKGRHFEEKDFHHFESKAMEEMYLYGGALLTSDMSCRIIAGSAVGGGTLVNYATAWKTPEHVLQDWARVSGIDAFTNGEIQESLDIIGERVNINRDETAPGRRDVLIEEGLTKLGWHVDVFPKAVKGCLQDASCGYCGYGCRVGAKQGTMKTFLPDATKAGARLYTGTDVSRVLIKDGRAYGVEGTSGNHRFTVTARAVISSCGSIETPALLLRSGLKGRVGRDLRLHPGTPAWAFFDEEVRAWEGSTQTRYSFELLEQDDHYGPTLETVPLHPGGAGGVLPWLSEKQHRDMMNRLDRLGFCGVLARDTSSGRVTINKDGSPKIQYRLNEMDDRHVIDGVIGAAKVMEAAGATEIFTAHPDPISYKPGPGEHDRWAEAVKRRGFRKNVTFFSYHQMGSCRMGVDPKSSAIGPENETHEVSGLYVMDASAFPTASGVNPMVSIYGITHRAAKKLATRIS